jgi:hypothetical protein
VRPAQIAFTVAAVIGGACGHASAPSIPFGALDDAALNRMYAICTPAKTGADPADTGRHAVPKAWKDRVTTPVHRVCDRVNGQESSFIDMVRDEKTGVVVNMTIFLRSPSGPIAPETIDNVLSLAVDPWIKVVQARDLHQFARDALAHPAATDTAAAHELSGPDWMIQALASEVDGATSFSLHVDPTVQ